MRMSKFEAVPSTVATPWEIGAMVIEGMPIARKPRGSLRNSNMIKTGSQTGKMIDSFDTYRYVQKEEFSGIEIGKVWSVRRAWTPFYPKAIGTWKI